MGIIRTTSWLRELQQGTKNTNSRSENIEAYYLLGKKLMPYFDDAYADEIMDYLQLHGLFHPEEKITDDFLLNLKENIFPVIQTFYRQLKNEFNGLDIPIFILPATERSRSMEKEFHGKAGLAFDDKLFLFISKANKTKELQALLTHEYHHVCRLSKLNGSKQEHTLLDSMIMEGLAEVTVEEKLGDNYLTPWATFYTLEEARLFWKKLLKRYVNIRASSPLHDHLLYGGNGYPKWLGYHVGYQLVKAACQNSGSDALTFMDADAKDVLSLSEFK